MRSNDSASRPLLYTIYFIYFFCGLTLCFEGAFNPEFKDFFKLGYQQQMYTMFAKNIPFALALGIGYLIPRLGYKHCLTTGMGLFAAGTLVLVPGLQTGSYALVLAAFFIIGLGFNFQLVAGNPLLSALGPANGASSRLNLGNALGAIAQILGPVSLSFIIPGSVAGTEGKLPYIKGLFAVIGCLLIGLAVFTLAMPNRTALNANTNDPPGAQPPANFRWFSPRLALAFVVISLALGAEAGLFGLYRNYLEDPSIAGLTSQHSQRMFTLYFAMFALGRVAGFGLQKKVRPAMTLIVFASAALTLLILIVSAKGPLAVTAITALGFFVSIFFPTLYAIAIQGLGAQTSKASGLLTMGFLGCAVLPVLQGRIADKFGLQASYSLAFVAYVAVLVFALYEIASPRQFADTHTKIEEPQPT